MSIIKDGTAIKCAKCGKTPNFVTGQWAICEKCEKILCPLCNANNLCPDDWGKILTGMSNNGTMEFK